MRSGRAKQEGITIWLGLRHQTRCDIAARARSIIRDNRHAEFLIQLDPQLAGVQVGRGPAGEAADDLMVLLGHDFASWASVLPDITKTAEASTVAAREDSLRIDIGGAPRQGSRAGVSARAGWPHLHSVLYTDFNY